MSCVLTSKLKVKISMIRSITTDKIHEAFLWQFGPLVVIIIQVILFLRRAFARS